MELVSFRSSRKVEPFHNEETVTALRYITEKLPLATSRSNPYPFQSSRWLRSQNTKPYFLVKQISIQILSVKLWQERFKAKISMSPQLMVLQEGHRRWGRGPTNILARNSINSNVIDFMTSLLLNKAWPIFSCWRSPLW